MGRRIRWDPVVALIGHLDGLVGFPTNEKYLNFMSMLLPSSLNMSYWKTDTGLSYLA